jgi:S-adenosylmethionine:tRNA ribosyltransferase-isomerase
MLVVEAKSGRTTDTRVRELPAWLAPGDVFVVNDAATLPASLYGATEDGVAIEARLLEPPRASETASETRATVALLGAGDWRTRTEARPSPPILRSRDVLVFGGLRARVIEAHGREAHVAFEATGARFWSALYHAGRPVQYAHLRDDLALWDVQTSFASRPWASEQPSAGRPLTWETLLALRSRGVVLARLTHAAGLSSVDGGAYDAQLPRAERYELPNETVTAVERARATGQRVVAVGTTVVRALEGCAASHGGTLVAGPGVTDLLLGPEHTLRVVDALLTGLHEPGTSHFRLLGAFAPAELLDRAHAEAQRLGYLSHELGDTSLILP